MSETIPRRTALINRVTNETKIQISLSLDGGSLDHLPDNDHFLPEKLPASNTPIPAQDATHHASQITASQHIWIWTGVGFLDHMLHAWSKHAGWSLRIRCRGDLASIIFPNPLSPEILISDLLSQSTTITPPKTPSSPSAPPSTPPSAPAPASCASVTRTRLSTKRSRALCWISVVGRSLWGTLGSGDR